MSYFLIVKLGEQRNLTLNNLTAILEIWLHVVPEGKFRNTFYISGQLGLHVNVTNKSGFRLKLAFNPKSPDGNIKANVTGSKWKNNLFKKVYNILIKSSR